MKKKLTSFSVLCPTCEEILGTVTETPDPDPKRVGFFHNVSTPEEIPGRCPTCDGFLARIPNNN